MVLLENHDKALPMSRSGNVAVFGVGSYVTVKGGTGSGAVNNRYTVAVREGFENAGYQVTTSADLLGRDDERLRHQVRRRGRRRGFGQSVDYSSVEQP